ncbi:MAG: hypothetical protein JWN41_1086 [Thermoleophilia bacterium]|nr:hypothetical protein [Thermoleophilia bacterium]
MKNLHLETIAAFLLIIGGLNAGISAVFDYNALSHIMSGDVSNVFYALVGLSAVWALADRFGFVGGEG